MLVAAAVAGLTTLTAFRPAADEAKETRLHSHQLEL
jgi:hypothetical protein